MSNEAAVPLNLQSGWSRGARFANPGGEYSDGIAGTLVAGFLVVLVMIGGLGVWGFTTKIAGAVVTSGTLVVESAVKKIQHQTGGTVGAILVHDGQHVRTGEVLFRLEDTMTRANLEILSQQYDRTLARRARLDAERIGEPTLSFPVALVKRARDEQAAAIMAGEQALFHSRAASLEGQRAQLGARIEQLGRQIEGLGAQKHATEAALELLEKDQANLQNLYLQKLVSAERVRDVELEVTRLQGETGRLAAALAEAEGRIAETKLQIIQLGEQMRAEANTDLREVEATEAELFEKKLVAEDQLKRVEVRAPQNGFVQEMAIHTVGGVIAPGETVMLLVPDADGLVIDAAVPPASIDDVSAGQPVSIRLSAFDASVTPVCKGTVQRVSADLIRDPRTQTTFYAARIILDQGEVCLAGERKLVPGMPVEVHIRTGERSAWSYILKPLADQMARAFKQ